MTVMDVTVKFLLSLAFLHLISFQIKKMNMKNITMRNGMMHEAKAFMINTEFPNISLLESARKQSNETMDSLV